MGRVLGRGAALIVAVLSVVTMPSVAAEPPLPDGIPEGGEPTVSNLYDKVVGAVEDLGGSLPEPGGAPPPPANPPAPQPSPEPSPDRPPEVTITIVDAELKEALGDLSSAGASLGDQAMALVSGALASLLDALGDLFGEDASSDGAVPYGFRALSVAVAKDPSLAVWILAASGAAVGGVALALRRVLPWLVFPLLSRIGHDDLLSNDARRFVANLIESEAGLSLHDIVGRTGYSRNAVSYHLYVLEKEELLISVKDGKYRRYFTRGGRYVNGAKGVVAVLKNPVTLQIAQYVREHPGAIQREVCRILSTSASAACWHTRRLETAGVLRRERAANTVKYFLGPSVEKYDLSEFGLVRTAPAVA